MSLVLAHADVRLRVVRMRDVKALERLILGNRAWLRPWEATNPTGPNSFDIRGMVKSLLRQFDAHDTIPFVIEIDGEVVGQVNVANIIFGSLSSAIVGYWVAPEVAGRGVTPTAVALACDYMFSALGLHRIEIAIRPENAASLRVVAKLGFRYEGLKERYIHINGGWRDHYLFALTSEEVPEGILNRWIRKQVPELRHPKPIEFEHTALND
jgi:ribosomal-protein-alanine N-acetyltransferase